MRSNKDRKLNLGTALRLTLMNKFVKKNFDVKIHKPCSLANTEETQCMGAPRVTTFAGSVQKLPKMRLVTI